MRSTKWLCPQKGKTSWRRLVPTWEGSGLHAGKSTAEFKTNHHENIRYNGKVTQRLDMTLTVLTFSTPCNCYIILPYSACRQEQTNYHLRINVFDTDQIYCVQHHYMFRFSSKWIHLFGVRLPTLFVSAWNKWNFVRVSTGSSEAHTRKIQQYQDCRHWN